MRKSTFVPVLVALLCAGCNGTGIGGGGSATGGTSGASNGAGSPASGSTALMGRTFLAASSRAIWEGITLPTTQTWRVVGSSAFVDIVSEFTADTVRGVACVKESGPDGDTWYAKDATGRVVVIREQDPGSAPHDPASFDQATWWPVAGAVGDSWVEEPAGDNVLWEVVAIDATAPHSGIEHCLVFRQTARYQTASTADDDTSYFWVSPTQGPAESSNALLPADQTGGSFRLTVGG